MSQPPAIQNLTLPGGTVVDIPVDARYRVHQVTPYGRDTGTLVVQARPALPPSVPADEGFETVTDGTVDLSADPAVRTFTTNNKTISAFRVDDSAGTGEFKLRITSTYS